MSMEHSTTEGARMNAAIKARWIAALTNGEYRQIHGALHKAWPHLNMFCALGVLCELHRLETHADYWRGPDGRGKFAYLENFDYLPSAVARWAGLPELPEMPISLIALDQQGLSFAGIAAEIARYL